MTAVFSLFAYVWLVVILVCISPEVVEVWEAILTFIFFPVLVLLAYATDKCCSRRSAPKSEDTNQEEGLSLKDTADGATEDPGFCKFYSLFQTKLLSLFYIFVVVI